MLYLQPTIIYHMYHKSSSHQQCDITIFILLYQRFYNWKVIVIVEFNCLIVFVNHLNILSLIFYIYFFFKFIHIINIYRKIIIMKSTCSNNNNCFNDLISIKSIII